MHFSRSYSKNKVPYQVTLEERYTTFRAKIEHLNITKRSIKYTYSESTIDEQFNTLILPPEVTKFKGSKRAPSTGTLLHRVKIGAPVLANFSKTAERNGTRPISKQSLAQAGSNKKKSSKSIHSTTSYSKVKVPYQITKKPGYSGCRAKIDHLNLQKRYIKYTYSESTLDGLIRKLIL